MDEIEAIRSQHKPEWIVTLFVGESAPVSGEFFYKGPTALTRHMEEAMMAAGLLAGDNFLEEFKALGWYLDDLVLDPVNHLSRAERNTLHRKWQDDLQQRIARYRPKAVVSLLFSIRDIVEIATVRGAPGASYHAAPFPGNGQQNRFKTEMARILPELPTLPKIRATARKAADELLKLRETINAPPFTWEEIKKMRDEGRR